MPIFVEVNAHFVLAHFDIKQRSLVVYKSLHGVAHRKTAIDDAEPLSMLIPVYLENTGFYDSRDNLEFTQGPYSVPRSSPLEVLVLHNQIKDMCSGYRMRGVLDNQIARTGYHIFNAMRKHMNWTITLSQQYLKQTHKIK